jgi:oligoendopeptidase F
MSQFNTNKTEWDFSVLFKSAEDPAIKQTEERIKRETDTFVQKWSENTDYLSDPAVLLEALREYEAWEEFSGNNQVYYYFAYQHYLDLEDGAIKACLGQCLDFQKEISNKVLFFTQRLAKVEKEKQKKFLDYAPLAPFKHYLETLFRSAEHLLSEAEEKVITLYSTGAYSNWKSMRSEFLAAEKVTVKNSKGEQQQMAFEELMTAISDKDKILRDNAVAELNGIFQKHIKMGEWELNSVLEYKKVSDTLRGYSRPDSATHLGDDVETEVVDALLEAVSSRNDIPQRFYKLKAQLLGLEKLAYHERNLEIGEVNKDMDWQSASKLVHEVLADLHPRFAQIFEDMVNGGKIDVYPRGGKYGGAFCSFGSKVTPVLVLLNHTDKLRDVTTIAHEMGHAINHQLMIENESSLNFGDSIFTAEVASTFMEDFVLQKLLEEADESEKLSIMMAKLNDDISSIFRQIACYRFEQELHEVYRKEGYVSAERIGQLFKKYMQAYMGDSVSQDEGSENWWLYWSHIRNYFYVYSYASGLIISKAMQSKYKHDKAFIENIKTFLSTGSSKPVTKKFVDMGIDITKPILWQQGISEVETLLQKTEELAKKLGKIS